MPQFEVVSLEEVLEMAENDSLLLADSSELAQCPECEGTNLNENATVCWDCHASDYAG